MFDLIFESALQLHTSRLVEPLSFLGSVLSVAHISCCHVMSWLTYYLRLFAIDITVVLTFYCVKVSKRYS